jgi:hypothetical protein
MDAPDARFRNLGHIHAGPSRRHHKNADRYRL